MKLKISVDGKAYEVDVEVPEEEHGPRLGGYVAPYAPHSSVTFAAPAYAPAPASAPKSNGEASIGEDKVCRSPIAGIVIKVNIQPGQ